jgi:DNA-binding response OmpR family regulator
MNYKTVHIETLERILTRKEWKIFMAISKPVGENGNELALLVDCSFNASNTIAVHIKNIRKKIRENALPIVIETIRRGSSIPGSYVAKHK